MAFCGCCCCLSRQFGLPVVVGVSAGSAVVVDFPARLSSRCRQLDADASGLSSVPSNRLLEEETEAKGCEPFRFDSRRSSTWPALFVSGLLVVVVVVVVVVAGVFFEAMLDLFPRCCCFSNNCCSSIWLSNSDANLFVSIACFCSLSCSSNWLSQVVAILA